MRWSVRNSATDLISLLQLPQESDRRGSRIGLYHPVVPAELRSYVALDCIQHGRVIIDDHDHGIGHYFLSCILRTKSAKIGRISIA